MRVSAFLQLASAMATVVAFLPTIVSGKDYAPYIAFNDEKEEPDKFCTPSEWNKVTKKIEEAYKEDKNTRHLRHVDIDTSSTRELSGFDIDTSSTRQLSACGCRYCWLKGTGCARDPNRRRNLGKVEVVLTDEEAYNKCTAGFLPINISLNELAPKLSTSCRALVESSRTYTCFERVQCRIENIIALAPDSGKVLEDRMPPNKKKLCNKSRITFQAETSFDYGTVTFDMKLPNGTMVNTRDTDAPFYMFGHNGTYVFGADFAVGEYTLDVGTTNSTKGGKSISFRVDDC